MSNFVMAEKEKLVNIANSVREATGVESLFTFPNGFLEALDIAKSNKEAAQEAQVAQAALKGVIEGTCTEITSNATKIRPSAFYGCANLTNINIPNATSIGSSAFL